MERRIRDLEEQLRKEKENLEGNAKERERLLVKELEEWKQKYSQKERELDEAKRQIDSKN
jgi:hypothetical protein